MLPEKLSRKFGGIGPLVLCYKISKSINIVDVKTMETYEIDNATYWKYQFGSFMTRSELTPFVVVNIENVDFEVNESKAAKRNKFKLAEVEVQRDSDIGVTDKTYFTYSHLGEVLEFNNTVLAYDLEPVNLEGVNQDNIPDVVLVKKSYPKSREKFRTKKRNWKLKHINVQADKSSNASNFIFYQIDFLEEAKSQAMKGGKKAAKIGKKVKKEEKSIKSKNQDYEIFLQDLEEDKGKFCN
jgi:nonsense-mediated mRNA decay protein 3